MLGFLVAGIATVTALLMMMARTNIRRWLGYANVVDILFTFAMVVLYHGTFSGVVAASFAGVVMSLALQCLRKLLGYEYIKVSIYEWSNIVPKFEWVRVDRKDVQFYSFNR